MGGIAAAAHHETAAEGAAGTVPAPAAGNARVGRGPIDPRLLRRAKPLRRYLGLGVAIGGGTALLAIAQAGLIAHAVADIVARRDVTTLTRAVGGLCVVFLSRALLSWLNDWLAQRTATAVKSELRADVLAARLRRPIDPPSTTATLITLLTTGLDGLDGYVSRYLPQLVLAATVPALMIVAIGTADLTAAVIVAVTLPLIPLFMALVGWSTQARTARRWRFQARLADHFADLVAGLPTLQVFGRARAQERGLALTEEAHRRETMATLRVSFLSSFVLELLATLSVAVVAVTVGFRVVFGELDLTTALFVLILAPEAYLPVRQVGVFYHDAADGVAAADAAFAEIEAAAPEAAGHRLAPSRGVVAVHELGHRYPGSPAPALTGLTFTVAPGEIVVLAGPSGGGKSTTLGALLGFLSPTEGRITVAGTDLRELDLARWRQSLTYVGQDPGMVAGTVADNVRLGYPEAPPAALRAALDGAGGSQIMLDRSVGDRGEGLSAGERRRVAVARALLRIELGGAWLLLLDEPTAGLDADAEATLVDGVRRLGVAAIVVSHRPGVIAAATRVVTVAAPVAA